MSSASRCANLHLAQIFGRGCTKLICIFSAVNQVLDNTERTQKGTFLFMNSPLECSNTSLCRPKLMSKTFCLKLVQAWATSSASSCTSRRRSATSLPKKTKTKSGTTPTAGHSTSAACRSSWRKWWAFWPSTFTSSATKNCAAARAPTSSAARPPPCYDCLDTASAGARRAPARAPPRSRPARGSSPPPRASLPRTSARRWPPAPRRFP